jgi:hypothetical protein
VVEGNKVSLRSRVDEPPPAGNHRSATALPPATQQRTNTRGFSVIGASVGSYWTQQSVAIQAARPERSSCRLCLYSLHLFSAEEPKGSYE